MSLMIPLVSATKLALVDGNLPTVSVVKPLTGLGLASLGCSDDLETACITDRVTYTRPRRLDGRTLSRPPVGVARLAVVFIALVGARPVVTVGVVSTVLLLDILHGLCVQFLALTPSEIEHSSISEQPMFACQFS